MNFLLDLTFLGCDKLQLPIVGRGRSILCKRRSGIRLVGRHEAAVRSLPAG